MYYAVHELVFKDKELPYPSLEVDSGGGYQFVWLFDGDKPKEFKREKWIKLQQKFLEVLKEYGADPAATDAARPWNRLRR
jgi:hypothetical protein